LSETVLQMQIMVETLRQ